MSILDIHKDITEQLDSYINENKVPNIIFNGGSGSGKKTIVKNFLNKIYKTEEEKKKYLLVVDCIQSNGIKFIRDDLKFFSKSQINSIGFFKTVLLLNAGHLTIDAQSALRRCIEQFSNTTRFFIIIEDKSKLLKPLISRFCDIYIPYPNINNKEINLYNYNKRTNVKFKQYNLKRQTWIKKYFTDNKPEFSNISNIVEHLYDNGYNCKDLEEYIYKDKQITYDRKLEILLTYNKISKDVRNEKLSMLYLINIIFFRLDFNLENISFM
tara:strand:+ start:17563 stop:18366 length:804 start_codon:yes stop_codon:yes gene_type:complete